MPTEPGKIAGVPVDMFVKGGTTSKKWDEDKQKFYAQTEQRQAHQDGQRAAVAAAAGRPDTRSALVSHQLSSPENPKVCLTYRAHDKALERQALCEVAVTELGKMVLCLVCPKCLERTSKMHDSQVMIRDDHRKFWLDTTRAAMWVDPSSGLSYRLAGTITTADLLSCSALGCTWRFRIDNSDLYGSDQFAL